MSAKYAVLIYMMHSTLLQDDALKVNYELKNDLLHIPLILHRRIWVS